jgi:hypothetical protein
MRLAKGKIIILDEVGYLMENLEDCWRIALNEWNTHYFNFIQEIQINIISSDVKLKCHL